MNAARTHDCFGKISHSAYRRLGGSVKAKLPKLVRILDWFRLHSFDGILPSSCLRCVSPPSSCAMTFEVFFLVYIYLSCFHFSIFSINIFQFLITTTKPLPAPAVMIRSYTRLFFFTIPRHHTTFDHLINPIPSHSTLY